MYLHTKENWLPYIIEGALERSTENILNYGKQPQLSITPELLILFVCITVRPTNNWF